MHTTHVHAPCLHPHCYRSFIYLGWRANHGTGRVSVSQRDEWAVGRSLERLSSLTLAFILTLTLAFTLALNRTLTFTLIRGMRTF